MSRTIEQDRSDFPYATEFITNARGQVSKVVLPVKNYRVLLETLEDSGLYRAMRKVTKERPMSREIALALLNQE